LDIGLISIRQYGLIASLRLYKQEVAIIESKPDNVKIDDLRVVTPFPELLQFAMNINMSSLDSQEHGHTPYVVILIQILQKWKVEVIIFFIKYIQHGGKLPKTTAEKDEFR
jgi:amyloid beta precursor protein binding protein 1